VRIRILGGWTLEHDGAAVDIVGDRQRALLFRLALDPQAHLGYRAIAEDVWPDDLPENPRAALQSLVSRLRSQLPVDVVASTPGGYRLEMPRDAVDAVHFQDLVAASTAAEEPDEAARLAAQALELWAGEPWTPDAGYDWLERDLARDHAAVSAIARRRAETPTATLPAPLTALVGRHTELARVGEQLALSRLVTILGPGGAGKTRLAVEAARSRPGSVLVELAPAGPDEVWQAVLGALGRDIRTDTASVPASVRERVLAAIHGRELLLVLDNCEHVIDAVAVLAGELLALEPRLRVLATSREPLALAGEAFVPLGPLDAADAERLFAERVLAARGRPLDESEQVAATRIRDRLDGLPLALELAAAKARTLSIDELASGLDDRFTLLSGGLRAVLPRHQTLRALIDWSWTLLDDDERELLMVVAIYPAGIAAKDASAVAGVHGIRPSAFDALVDKSLLQRTNGRFRALETIREYGLERLGESGALDRRRREQARRYADVVGREDARLRSAAIHDALAWFDVEDDTLAGVLRYAVASGLDAEAVAIVAGTAWYWIIRDRNEDAMTWLAQVGPLADRVDGDAALLVRTVTLMVRAFSGMAEAEALPSDLDLATEIERLRELSAASDNDILQVMPILMSAFGEALTTADWPAAVVFPSYDRTELRPWPRAMLAAVRSAMAFNRGDAQELGAASELSLRLFEEIGDLWGLALARQMRSQWLALEGRFEEALLVADQSTEDLRAITSSWDLQQQQGLGVMLLMRLGREQEARDRAEQLITEAEVSGSSRSVVFAHVTNALLEIQFGDADAAENHLDAADRGGAEWVGDDWPGATAGAPPQLAAHVGVVRARIALLRRQLPAAEDALDAAARAAAESHDRPIMASVAVAVGHLAFASGDLAAARDALQLAARLRGAVDPSDTAEEELRNALEAAPTGSGEPAGAASDAVESLLQILRR
jgi:predicted ATPase/tetratricopeptide (TPR) repeat protein